MTSEATKKALLVIDVQQNLVDPSSRMHVDTIYIRREGCGLSRSGRPAGTGKKKASN